MDTKEILGYAAGSIGSAVLAVIILPLLSWYFPADDIGRIVLMQTAAGLTVSVLCLGLDQAYVREYYAAADKDTLFKTLFLPPLLSAAAIAALLLSRPSLPSEILFSLDDAAAGIGLVLFELSFLPIRFLLLVLRMEGRALAFSSAQLVPKLAILLLPLTVGLLHFPANTAVLTAVYALANLAAAAFLLFQNRCRLKAVRHAPFSPAVLHRGLRYGIPIALSSIAYWGLASADRLFLKNMPVWNSSAFIRWVFRSAGRHYCSKASFQRSGHRIFSAQSKKTPRPPASRQRQNPPPPCLPPPSA